MTSEAWCAVPAKDGGRVVGCLLRRPSADQLHTKHPPLSRKISLRNSLARPLDSAIQCRAHVMHSSESFADSESLSASDSDSPLDSRKRGRRQCDVQV